MNFVLSVVSSNEIFYLEVFAPSVSFMVCFANLNAINFSGQPLLWNYISDTPIYSISCLGK